MLQYAFGTESMELSEFDWRIRVNFWPKLIVNRFEDTTRTAKPKRAVVNWKK